MNFFLLKNLIDELKELINFFGIQEFGNERFEFFDSNFKFQVLLFLSLVFFNESLQFNLLGFFLFDEELINSVQRVFISFRAKELSLNHQCKLVLFSKSNVRGWKVVKEKGMIIIEKAINLVKQARITTIFHLLFAQRRKCDESFGAGTYKRVLVLNFKRQKLDLRRCFDQVLIFFALVFEMMGFVWFQEC